MALEFQFDMDNGIELSTAYAKIQRVEIDYENYTARADVSIYKDAQARTENKKPLMKQMIRFPDSYSDYYQKSEEKIQEFFNKLLSSTIMSDDGNNALSQAYALVKEANFFKLKNPTDI